MTVPTHDDYLSPQRLLLELFTVNKFSVTVKMGEGLWVEYGARTKL